MSTVPPAALVMGIRRKRTPPPPCTAFRWPVLVKLTLPLPARTTLYPGPLSPSTNVPALVMLTLRSTQLVLPATVITWPAAIPGCAPVPVSGYGGAPGVLVVDFAAP